MDLFALLLKIFFKSITMTLEQNETVNMKQSQGNDELDLFDILELLWAKKWIIICSVLLGVIIGFGYLKFEKTKYRTSIDYSFNLYSIRAFDYCGPAIRYDPLCLEDETNKVLKDVIANSWISAKLSLVKNTNFQPDREKLFKSLKGINKQFTENLVKDASAYLSLVMAEPDLAIRSSDFVAINTLRAKRIIKYAENGGEAINFGNLKIKDIGGRAQIIVPITVILGVFFGCAIIFLQEAFYNRLRKKLT
jgi:hypothetical protein